MRRVGPGVVLTDRSPEHDRLLSLYVGGFTIRTTSVSRGTVRRHVLTRTKRSPFIRATARLIRALTQRGTTIVRHRGDRTVIVNSSAIIVLSRGVLNGPISRTSTCTVLHTLTNGARSILANIDVL